MKNRTLISYLFVSVRGFCMGAADVVPGVSGGTMALILGIYEELIKSIRSFDAIFVKRLLSFKAREAMSGVSWQFLAALIIGIFAAIFSLSRILSWLLENRPVFIWSFFFGLVLASIFTVGRNLDRWHLGTCVWIALGAIGAYFLVGMVPLSTPDAPWFLLLSGAVAICAMILPGISGSFILVLMGKYKFLLDAVNNHNILPLILVATGAVVGLSSFVRLLNWLLKKHHDATMAVLTGLMLGALRKVWPWKVSGATAAQGAGKALIVSQANTIPAHWSQEVTMALLLAALGFFLVLALNALANKGSSR